jgi:hypothetical protein
MFDSRQREGLFSSLPCPDGPPNPPSPNTTDTEGVGKFTTTGCNGTNMEVVIGLSAVYTLRTLPPYRLIASEAYVFVYTAQQWSSEKVKGLYWLMLPDFRKRNASGKLFRPRPFALVRATCR